MTTREKILQAALELFVQNGINKTSTAKISEKVGLSSGALFVHFPTKQNLIEELYLDRKKCSIKDFKEVFSLSNSVEYNIRSITQRILEYYAQHKLDFLYIRMVQSSPQISERVLEVMKDEYARQSSIIQSWIEAGKIKEMDSDLLGQVWWSLLIPMIEKMHRENILKAKPEWIDFIWKALRA